MNDLNFLNLQKEQFSSLDYLITENEIFIATKKLQNNKSAFSDKRKNEMIKASIQKMMPAYLTVRLLKPGPPRQCKPIRWQNRNNRFKHFQIQPIKCPIFKSGQSNARYKTMKSQLVRRDARDYGICNKLPNR